MNFALHPKLAADSEFVCDLPLSQVRLSLNAAFPWLILIPRQARLIEIIDLNETAQNQLWHEIRHVSHVMKDLFHVTKLNIANLGNIVSQLHIHVIARFEDDKAWPNPIWNSGIQAEYTPEKKQFLINHFIKALQATT